MKKLVYPLSLMMIVAAMTACANNNASPVTPNQGPQTQNAAFQRDNTLGTRNATNTRGNYSNTGTLGTGYTNNNTFGYNNYNVNGYNRALADRLAVAADAVPGVEGATAIVYGDDAVIGINTRFATANDSNQRRVVEQQVRSAARAVAPQYDIRVTSDRSMVTRIVNLDNTFRSNIGTANNNGTIMNGDGNGFFGGNGGTRAGNGNGVFTGGPNTVTGNLGNAGNDFAALVRDLGRTITAPFR